MLSAVKAALFGKKPTTASSIQTDGKTAITEAATDAEITALFGDRSPRTPSLHATEATGAAGAGAAGAGLAASEVTDESVTPPTGPAFPYAVTVMPAFTSSAKAGEYNILLLGADDEKTAFLGEAMPGIGISLRVFPLPFGQKATTWNTAGQAMLPVFSPCYVKMAHFVLHFSFNKTDSRLRGFTNLQEIPGAKHYALQYADSGKVKAIVPIHLETEETANALIDAASRSESRYRLGADTQRETNIKNFLVDVIQLRAGLLEYETPAASSRLSLRGK